MYQLWTLQNYLLSSKTFSPQRGISYNWNIALFKIHQTSKKESFRFIILSSPKLRVQSAAKMSPLLKANFLFFYIRLKENVSFLETMISSMNLFCKAFVLECQAELCVLGDEIFHFLLNIWKSQSVPLKVIPARQTGPHFFSF